MISDTLVLPFLEVTVCVSPFHSTVAPNASNIARSGTSVRPSIIIGGWSKFTSCPFTFTVISAEFKSNAH